MDTQQQPVTDNKTSATEKDLGMKTPEEFESAINKKMGEIENILFDNFSAKEQIEKTTRSVEEAVALDTDEAVLAAIEQILGELKKFYRKEPEKSAETGITDEAHHLLTDIDNDRIPPLRSNTLTKIVKDHDIDPNDTAQNLIQKLKDLRDKTPNEEPDQTKVDDKKISNIDLPDPELLKDWRKQRVYLRVAIFEEKKLNEKMHSAPSDKLKRLQAELSELDKKIGDDKVVEKIETNTEAVKAAEKESADGETKEKPSDIQAAKIDAQKIEEVKEKIDRVTQEIQKETAKISSMDEKPESKTPDKTPDGSPKVFLGFPFAWLKQRLSPRTNNNEEVIAPNEPKPSDVQDKIPAAQTERPETQTKESPLDHKPVTPEESLQKLSEPYTVKEGDVIRKILETKLEDIQKFQTLDPRQKNFILDSMNDAFNALSGDHPEELGMKKGQVHILPKDILTLDKIFRGNKYLISALKRIIPLASGTPPTGGGRLKITD
ncbi:MAG: hypothetical protein WCT49_00240 [Candidatus Paceibacterota bacterium]|jgi:hypothetical protein|nr:Atg14 domain-containing protein [Candidatus Paceibacterota bacterium]